MLESLTVALTKAALALLRANRHRWDDMAMRYLAVLTLLIQDDLLIVVHPDLRGD